MFLSNNNQEELSEKKGEFITKCLKDDEKKYESMEKRLAEDRSFPELFNKNKKGK